MGFASAIPLASSAIGAIGGAAGGKGGKESSSGSAQAIDIRNFLDFQQPALSSLFNRLGDPSLLGVPESATSAVDEALASTRGLLGQLAGIDPLGDLQGLRDIVNEDISKQPFQDVQDRFERLSGRAEQLTDAELARDPTALVKSLLLPTAEGRFLPGQDLANKFFEPGVVQPALTDARNQIATLFTNSGRLNSPSAAQTVARESGRISGGLRSNQFNQERANQLNASTAIGGFDQNEGIRRLNLINSGLTAQQNATSGLLGSVSADEARRASLLGLRGGISGQQLGLQSNLLSSLPGLATAQTQLPFVPLTNFANIASLPLGKQGTILQTGTATQPGNGLLSNIAGGALAGKGIGTEIQGSLGGKGGANLTGGSGSDVFRLAPSTTGSFGLPASF